jgi:hypothetical protein
VEKLIEKADEKRGLLEVYAGDGTAMDTENDTGTDLLQGAVAPGEGQDGWWEKDDGTKMEKIQVKDKVKE